MGQHGLVMQKPYEVVDHDEELSNSWLKEHNIPGHVEGYTFAIQERGSTKVHCKSHMNNAQFDSKCHHCPRAKGNIFDLEEKR